MRGKMKWVLIILMLCSLVMPPAAWAGTPLEKLARGIINVATSPGEFIYQIDPSVKSTPDKFTGYVVALFRGTFFTVKRAGVGLYDIVTFPIPEPHDYAPVYQPETLVNDVFYKGSYFTDPTPAVRNG